MILLEMDVATGSPFTPWNALSLYWRCLTLSSPGPAKRTTHHLLKELYIGADRTYEGG
jgi:hypothetical protein